MGLKERLKRAERKGDITRIRCTECGQRWVAGEDVELNYFLELWREGMGHSQDPTSVVAALREHEHQPPALIYAATGQQVFGECRRTPSSTSREVGF
jgi:hypothetical protein